MGYTAVSEAARAKAAAETQYGASDTTDRTHHANVVQESENAKMAEGAIDLLDPELAAARDDVVSDKGNQGLRRTGTIASYFEKNEQMAHDLMLIPQVPSFSPANAS